MISQVKKEFKHRWKVCGILTVTLNNKLIIRISPNLYNKKSCKLTNKQNRPIIHFYEPNTPTNSYNHKTEKPREKKNQNHNKGSKIIYSYNKPVQFY